MLFTKGDIAGAIPELEAPEQVMDPKKFPFSISLQLMDLYTEKL